MTMQPGKGGARGHGAWGLAGRGGWGLAVALAAILALAAAPPARADGQGPGVARISLVAGSVSVLRQGQGQWTQAVLNTPLVQGDEVYVAGGGRAEIQFDYADTIRLASGADLKVGKFDGGQLQLELKGGTASFTAVGPHFLSNQIDTPNMSVRLIRAGTVRIDVVDASHTSATVWDGTAEVSTPQGSVNVDAGQQIQVAGSTNPQFRVVSAPAEDAWDHWVNQREERVLKAADYNDHELSEQVEGGADLDTYGHWVYVPNYGRCWQPWGVAVGWTPYYYGQWEWTPFYGWTWVSYEPWGWAPYHYGRWFWEASFGWCWWPGSFWGPHIWAPAYVSFFWGGPAWCRHYGFGVGAIGWIPLGPYEHYYGYSRVNYITRVTNITNIYNINHIRVINGVRTVNGMPLRDLRRLGRLRNAHAPGGIVAISQRGFARGRVDQGGRKLGYGALRGVSLVRGTAPVAPSRASLGFGARGVAAPRAVHNVRVFSRQPVRAGRVRVASLGTVDHAMNAARARAGIAAQPREAVARRRGNAMSAGGRVARPAARGTTRRGGEQSRIAAAAASSRARARADANRAPSFRIFGSAAGNRGRALRSSGPQFVARNGWRSFGADAGSGAAYARGGVQRQPFPARSDGRGAAPRFENHPMGGGSAAAAPWGPDNGASRGFRGRAGARSGAANGPGGVRMPGFENHPMQAAPRSGNRGGLSRNPGRLGGFENHPFQSHPFENHPMASMPRENDGGFGRQGGSAPAYRAPSYRAPAYRAPAYRAPAYRAPSYRAPSYRAPSYRAPAYHAPAYRAPSYHAPAYHAPAYHGGGGRRH